MTAHPLAWALELPGFQLWFVFNHRHRAATGAQGLRLCCTARAVACPSLTIALPIPTPPASLLGAAQKLGGRQGRTDLCRRSSTLYHNTAACVPAGRLGASWHFTKLFPPGHFAHKVWGAAAYKSFPLLTARHRTPPEARNGKRHPARQPSPCPYLSSLESVAQLTVGVSEMRACTLCWPETRDTSRSESCPAPVESSCLS